MRKISEKIIEKMSEGTKGQFTLSVRDAIISNEQSIVVLLWGNPIFKKKEEKLFFSLCGYDTQTTTTRLNDLLEHFFNAKLFHKNSELFIRLQNGEIEKINSKSVYQIEADSVTEYRKNDNFVTLDY